MKKKVLFLLSALLLLSGFAFINDKPVQASSYGRIGEVTPPARMRGKWYYHGSKMLGQNPHKIYKVKITKHRVNGIRLYQANMKVTQKYAKHFKKYRFVVMQTMTWGRASIYNLDNIKWLNVNGWTAGAGNGTSYGLVTRTKNSQPVRALAIGIGYKPFIVAYAFHKHSKPLPTNNLLKTNADLATANN